MSHSYPCMLSQIDNAIDQINEVKKFMDDCFINLNNMAQESVDEYIVNSVNPYINDKLASIRASLLSSLQAQYKSFKAFSESLEPINGASPTNLSSVIDFCLSVKDFLVGAYNTLMTFMTLLPEHLIRLTAAISSIVTYVPPIQGISFDKLDIQMEPISMADITGE